MTKRTFDQIENVLREMDPAPPIFTEDERDRAAATRDRIVATPGTELAPTPRTHRNRNRRRALIAAAIVAIAAVAVPVTMSRDSALASWSATPQPLSATDTAAAATMCGAIYDTGDDMQPLIGEKRGGWNYVLIQGPAGEGACLMTDDYLERREYMDRSNGFFSTFDADPSEPPTVASDEIVEWWSMESSFLIPGRLPFPTTDGWITWASGYVGSDVTAVTAHMPAGPDVEATVDNGRFSIWWPGPEPKSDTPGLGEAWTYTVTLTDGTTRQTTGEEPITE